LEAGFMLSLRLVTEIQLGGFVWIKDEFFALAQRVCIPLHLVRRASS
jgi:hypothetical protein